MDIVCLRHGPPAYGQLNVLKELSSTQEVADHVYDYLRKNEGKRPFLVRVVSSPAIQCVHTALVFASHVQGRAHTELNNAGQELPGIRKSKTEQEEIPDKRIHLAEELEELYGERIDLKRLTSFGLEPVEKAERKSRSRLLEKGIKIEELLLIGIVSCHYDLADALDLRAKVGDIDKFKPYAVLVRYSPPERPVASAIFTIDGVMIVSS